MSNVIQYTKNADTVTKNGNVTILAGRKGKSIDKGYNDLTITREQQQLQSRLTIPIIKTTGAI